MRRLSLLVVVLLGACSKDSKPAAGPRLDCNAVLPTALREKYFAGWTIKDAPQPVASKGECSVTNGTDDIKVGATCHPSVPLSMSTSINLIKKSLASARDLPGIGKGGVIVDPGTMDGRRQPVQVTVWDDDSDCNVSIVAPASVDSVALARDLIATLHR